MSDSNILEGILKEVQLKSSSIINKTSEIQNSANFAKEFADISIANFDQSPLKDNPTLYIDNIQKVSDNLAKVITGLDTINSVASGVSFGTASAMSTISGTLTPNNYRSNPAYTPFFLQFDYVLDRGSTKDFVIKEIHRLGLDSRIEGIEAINLLEAAWNIHTQGVGISTSTLIPLREAIEKTLVAIRTMTPSPHSKLKKWIIEICSTVCFSTITRADLQELQSEHDLLRDKLSGSKSGNYSREDERTLVRDGTLHLLKILNVIDSSKLI